MVTARDVAFWMFVAFVCGWWARDQFGPPKTIDVDVYIETEKTETSGSTCVRSRGGAWM